MHPGAAIGSMGILITFFGIFVWSGLLPLDTSVTPKEQVRNKRKFGVKAIILGLIIVIFGMIIGRIDI